MNQMGHGVPNLVGIRTGALDQRVRTLLPGYMTIGPYRHGRHGRDGNMPVLPNAVPMRSGRGKHDYITMGGMFTVLKVRETLRGYADPGWYDAPAGTQAREATDGRPAPGRHPGQDLTLFLTAAFAHSALTWRNTHVRSHPTAWSSVK
jgi:hypothetical protein